MSRWLTGINYAILGLILLFGAGIGIIWLNNPDEITCGNIRAKASGLPKGYFELTPEAYQAIDGPLLALEQIPPSMQLPDLRQQLMYYGKNGRPDAQALRSLLHFSFNGNKAIVSIPPGEPLYLIYEKKNGTGKYVFSPGNEKTSFWIVGKPIDAEVEVTATLQNDKGECIKEPENCHIFRLPEKEFARFAGNVWELGSWRVDGTLLARQKAKWFGPDRFLEKHGGDEYKEVHGRQRIDFGENDDIYSIFAKVGDCFVWVENRWKLVEPGEDSLNKPLLLVKKVDERLMGLELWDIEGKGKVLLNLLKSSEPWMTQNAQHIQNMFKFVGARTRSQCVFEINQERMTVSPSDWLLLTAKGWKKLSTGEEIDQYVKRKTPGTLFVFEGLARKDERQIMQGTLYNPSRSDCQSVELALQPGGNGHKKSESKDAKESREANEAAEVLAEKGLNFKGKNQESMHPMHPLSNMPPKAQTSTSNQ